MSAKPKKVDPNHVSQRVQQTKKEIEQLKLELQKLINRGIDSDRANINTTTVSENKNENQSHESRNIPSIPLQSSAQHHSYVIKKPPPTFIPKRDYNKDEKNSEVSPKKVKHYNVEETREYMKKQKEKRMEKMKMQVQASQSVIDKRKEKLKELQKKSLELVQKNVNLKRDRSRSRDRKTVPETQTSQNEVKPTNRNLEVKKKNIGAIKGLEENTHRVPDVIINNIKDIPSICLNKDHDIQTEYDSKNVNIDNLIKFNDLQKQYTDLHQKAAVKIQSYYRGYRQKKLYKKSLKSRKRRLNNIINIAKPVLNAEKPKEMEDPTKNNVPFWLQTAIQPYPYNFITAVRKKLNLATNTPIKTSSDIGIQISVEEPEKLQMKTKEEIKKAITDSIKEAGSFASHKCLDLSLKNIKDLHVCKEKLHNSENDCDIKKHSENYFIKPSRSKPKHKKHVNILDNEASESDTSKNIPDISSESTISTTHSKNPNEIDATSECKLDINIDKLKNLKIRERKFDSCEDTMFLLSDNKYKEDKILLKEVPQISEYTENSTKHSANIQVNLGSSASLKSKPASKGSVLQSKHSKSHENVRNHSASEQRKNKSDTNILNSNSSKSNSNNELSQKMSRSENHIVTDIDLNKLSKRSANIIPVKNSKSESNVSKLSEQRKSKKGFHSEIESDDNLKSFLEYMTSVEDSKKSRRSRSLQKKSTSQRNSNSFKTLPSKSEKMSESTDNSAQTEKGSTLVENYSSNFSNSTATISSSVPLLQRPSVTLTTSERMELPVEEQSRNSISIRPGEVKCIESKTNTNQIHLKFEAELHLLNDFNESLRQFMAVEKSLFELHGKNQQNTTIYQNQDTQTTIPLSPTTLKRSDDTVDTESARSQVSDKIISTINYRRGSDIVEVEEKTSDILEDFQQDSNLIEDGQQEINNFTIKDDKSILTGLGLSQLNESMNSTMDVTASNVSVPDISFNSNVYVGFSIGMFDQLIKDEDARIENLKTILKIREKALLDRTKGELAWLEIQKKQLIETGQLHEASLLKKKQRGIIIKLQHEKQEMQRLKQIQKAASKERKTILKEQRNMIKAQLSNNNQIPKIRRSVYKERRQVGPVKVYNLHRETINTETSISRRSSVAEEIIITSRSESIVGQISEEGAGDQDASMTLNTSFKGALNKRNEEAKKSLLMREAALQKRKKAAEELLQWHQRLLEEERKIAELEMAANTLIKQVPVHVGDSLCKSDDEKYDFKGTQLNFLWTNMTGRKEKKFKDEETYSLNQIALEKFCTDAKRNITEDKHSSGKNEKSTTSISNNSSIKTIVDDLVKDKSDFRSNSLSKSARIEDTNSSSGSIETESGKSISNVDKSNQSHEITYSYTSEFDSPEIIDVEEENESNTNKTNTEILVNEIDRSKSTLNEIMQNISNITDEISAIYKLSSVANTVKDESVLPTIQTENGSVKTEVTNNDIIRKDADDTPQGDESEDDTLKSSAQSEIVKSLTELISSQNACQDIKSEQKHNIIETPEPVRSKNTLTDSQGTLASNIELCINSNKPKGDTNNAVTNDEGSAVSLHTDLNKELSREDVNNSIVSVQEEEEYTNSSEGNTANISTSKRSGDINDLRKESDNRSVMTEMCSVNNTSNIIKNDIAPSNEESQNNEISESILSKSENQQILDLSYGFTGVRTNVSETISSKTKTNSTEGKLDLLKELPLENGYYNVDVEVAEDNMVESKENFVNKNDNLNENENQVKCVLETNIKNNSITDKLNIVNSIYHDLNDDFNKSLEETTISTESGFEKSIHAEEKNEADIHEENFENNVGDVLKTKLSSPVETSDLIVNNNNDKNLIDKPEIDEDNLEEIIEEKSSVDDIKHSVNESVNNSSESIDINDSINSASPKEIDSTVNTEDEKNISDLSGKSSDNGEETSPKINRDKIVLNLEKLYDINEIKPVNLTKDNNESAVNVKKRVSEILADTSSVREDKSPRLQDIYTTTYDILSPEHSPDLESPANNERNIAVVTQLYDEEAEALFKKQLAIEQEIKQLEQQQKEHIPYIYMREIPNKPPPPYTPPSSQIHATSVLPSSVEQLQSMISIITDKLFKAYESVNIESASPNTSEELKLLSKANVDKECYEFVFDLCKEFAIEHYKQFVEQTGPSWMVVNQKLLIKQKPFNKDELNAYLFKKTKEILGFEKVVFKEKMITKWSRKKRDHVDEILVIESQAEESEWTNYDDDEMIVKNELTNDIMNMLLTETANVISKIFKKKMNLS